MVDLGAGTCDTAGLIASMAGLENPIVCVDPVREMLDIGIRNKMEYYNLHGTSQNILSNT